MWWGAQKENQAIIRVSNFLSTIEVIASGEIKTDWISTPLQLHNQPNVAQGDMEHHQISTGEWREVWQERGLAVSKTKQLESNSLETGNKLCQYLLINELC